jgi:hypothetical protein
MSVFKYFTFGYWYDAWEEKQRSKILKKIEHTKENLVELDKFKTEHLTDLKTMEWCNAVKKIWQTELRHLENRI